MSPGPVIPVIGGGLAGVEAAYQIVKAGCRVRLIEMRPTATTEAHSTPHLGEMVCSNSLGSTELSSAAGLLKEELRRLDSFFLRLAEQARVPAGQSLSVDRLRLAASLDCELARLPGVEIERREVTRLAEFLDAGGPVIVASGPLTSPALAAAISEITLRRNLFFFDATSPLIHKDSIDLGRVFPASRYGKGEADFINIPLTREEYDQLVVDLTTAETVETPDFEKDLFFEACLPVEEIARRGPQSLAFGPLKPVGLVDPRTGRQPHAVVQLRQEDVEGRFYQLVGFQTRLKYGEQKRVFSRLPGLEKVEFERFGRMHRNTYLNGPLILDALYRCKTRPTLFFAGQISGVEGYVESVSSGLVAGFTAARMALGQPVIEFPPETAVGALARHIATSSWKDFRPSKFTFGLLPAAGLSNRNKKLKKEAQAARALERLSAWNERPSS